MRTLLLALPLLTLLSAPLPVAGATTATMQVSFTVLASCRIDASATTAPAVACAQAGSFILAPHRSLRAGTSDAPGWTVYF